MNSQDVIALYWVIFIFSFVIMAFLGSYVSRQKNRPSGEGFVLGLLFGPLGVIIAALLPNVTKAELQEREEEMRKREAQERVRAERFRKEEEARLETLRISREKKRQERIQRLPDKATSKTIGLILIIGLLIASGTAFILRHNLLRNSANMDVALMIQEAKNLQAQNRFSEAISVLKKAFGTRRATNLSEASQLLDEVVEKQQVSQLFDNAISAISQQQAVVAISLLRRYVSSAHATRKEQAILIINNLTIALSDVEASNYLMKMSKEDFAAFADQGILPAFDRMENEELRNGTKLRIRPGERMT